MNNNCVFCLNSDNNIWNTNCCNIFAHYHCQVKFGNECVICKKQIKCVSSTKYLYTNQDYNDYISLLESITEHIIEAYLSDDSDSDFNID